MKESKLRSLITKCKKYGFLFTELVKRDFKKKYKRTYLGMLWSILSPLLTLLVMRVVFGQFFGKAVEHYIIYLFCGNIIFSYFSDATSGGMGSLLANADIFTKINIPKYLFLFSRNISSLINFGLTFAVFLIFCIIDGITFTFAFFLLIIPIVCLIFFNIGAGLVLSALFVLFRDLQYLWSVFTTLLMYASAIFYTVDGYSPLMQRLFLCNPIYVYIKYFRIIVIDNAIPSIQFNLLAIGYAALAFVIGIFVYKKLNHKFLYYV
ncbi:MAG: ABC transporter permease [Clostridia bacterium]|nr:ABC transporter permease [Clostridia bacterium]